MCVTFDTKHISYLWTQIHQHFGREFDVRYERSIRKNTDEWKMGYYKVLFFAFQVRCVLMKMYV